MIVKALARIMLHLVAVEAMDADMHCSMAFGLV